MGLNGAATTRPTPVHCHLCSNNSSIPTARNSLHAGRKRAQASPDIADKVVDNDKKRAKKEDSKQPAAKTPKTAARKNAKKDTDKDAAVKPQQQADEPQQAEQPIVEEPVPMEEDEEQEESAEEDAGSDSDSEQEADDSAPKGTASRRSGRSAAQGMKTYKEKGERKGKKDLVVKTEAGVDDETTAILQTKGQNSGNSRR